MKTRKIFLLVMMVILIFQGLKVRSAILTYSDFRQGEDIRTNTTLMVSTNIGWGIPSGDVKVKYRVYLKYNLSATYLSDMWDIAVPLLITRKDAAGLPLDPVPISVTLNLNQDYSGIANDLSVYKTEDAETLEVQVNNAGILTSFTQIPDDIQIVVERCIERYAGIPTVPVIGTPLFNSTDNTLNLTWTMVLGAEEYDLEWYYLSKHNYNMPTLPETIDDAFFERNATRVTVRENMYNINLAYDEGYLFYRVRCVGKRPYDYSSSTLGAFDRRLFGSWSTLQSGSDATQLSSYVYYEIQNNFDPQRNWNYMASYAEEGKKKELLSFYDGTQRQRQAVTIANTENVALISETFYDFEGRKSIVTLPAPNTKISIPQDFQRDSKLKFYEAYSLNNNGIIYSHRDFDKDATTCSPFTPNAFSNASGAANYYSTSNQHANDSYILSSNYIEENAAQYIPDAGQYPFTQTSYGTDGNARMQTLAGDDFKMGSGHEMEYWTVSSSQDELDRLFGNDIGDAKHYTKKITRDQNGQLYVTYSNLAGKVIASWMVGDPPASLSSVASPLANKIDIFNGYNNPSDNAIIMSKSFPVIDNSLTYHFSYKITKAQYTSLCSENAGCEYQLYFRITNDCNDIIQPTSPSMIPSLCGAINTSTFLTNQSFIIDNACLSGSDLNVAFDVVFPRIGNYTITKVLRLNEGGFQTAQSLFNNVVNANCIETSPTSIHNQFITSIDDCECDPRGCLLPTQPYVEQDTCECSNLLAEMVKDMSPSGQYFDNILADISPISFPSSANHNTNWLTYSGGFDGNPNPRNHIVFPNAWPLTLYSAETPPLIDPYFQQTTLNEVWKVANFLDLDANLLTNWNDVRSNWNDAFLFNYFKDYPAYIKKYYTYTNGETPGLNPENNFPYIEIGNYSAGTQTHGTISGRKRLIEFHPEFNRYIWCRKFRESKLFTLDVFRLTYSGANSHDYINCTGCTVAGEGLLNADPFFSGVNAVYAASKADMLIALGNYNPAEKQCTTQVSMWDYTTDVYCNPYPLSSSASSGEIWQEFLNFYFAKRAEFIQSYINMPDNPTIPFTDYKPLCDVNLQVTPVDYTSINGIAEDCNPPYTTNHVAGFHIRSLEETDILTYVAAGGLEELDQYAQQIVDQPPLDLANLDTYNTNICTVPAKAEFTMDSFSKEDYTLSIYANSINIIGLGLNDDFIVTQDYTSASQLIFDIVARINQTVTIPDFTAQVDMSDDAKFIVYAPIELGDGGNIYTVDIQLVAGSLGLTLVNPMVGMTGGQSGVPCPGQSYNCGCDYVNTFATYYNSLSEPEYSTFESFLLHALENVGKCKGEITNEFITSLIASCSTTNKPPANSPTCLKILCEVDCLHDPTAIANFAGINTVSSALGNLNNDFIFHYTDQCITNIVENNLEDFRVQYQMKEYQYTLYYYDLAGNLIKTVSPEGVKPLTLAYTYGTNSNINQVQAHRVPNSTDPPVYPNHWLFSDYYFNSRNNIASQSTPDGGTTSMFYDKAGRLRFSQNMQQQADNVFSYVRYDKYNRVIESGESSQQIFHPSNIGADYWAILIDPSTINNYIEDNNYPNLNNPYPLGNINNKQVVHTYYDDKLNFTTAPCDQENLAGRVAMVSYEENGDNDDFTYDVASLYSYDFHGNVNQLLQQNILLAALNNQNKKIDYLYDLISNKVNQVSYQQGQPDQYYQRFEYDADNRLVCELSSKEGTVWTNDAKYYYYLHGPLARIEMGDQKVQGIDYAYTINGWIKGVNSNGLNKMFDIGHDGMSSVLPMMHKAFPADAYAYSLGYFNGDYTPIGSISQSNNFVASGSWSHTLTSPQLFNGNITQMATTLTDEGGNIMPQLSFFKYDQLNRLIQSDLVQTYNDGYNSWDNNGSSLVYHTETTFDRNGNIKSLKRNGCNGCETMSPLALDDLTYYYQTSPLAQGITNNRLLGVNDAVVSSNYSTDIDDQGDVVASNNYQYDATGKLTYDKQEQIDHIKWNVYGKVTDIIREGGSIKPDLKFTYDPTGNRISKTVMPKNAQGNIVSNTQWAYTYYTRDAQGNIMATYTKEINGSDAFELKLNEYNLYGAARLGVVKINKFLSEIVDGPKYLFERGIKLFELTDHLGNVLSTVNDAKTPHDDNTDGITDYYTANVISAQDYFPGGMLMPGRSFNSSSNRYGFNGKENDNEVYGSTGTFQDYGMRSYDTRIGRFISVDPITAQYPELTPYQFASNTPIQAIDLDGKEAYYTSSGELIGMYGNNTEIRVVYDSYVQKAADITAKQGSKSPELNVMNNQIYNKGSAGVFCESDDAAIDWTSRYHKSAIDEKVEKSSDIFVLKINNELYKTYEEPVSGTGTQVSNPFRPKTTDRIHSHANYLKDYQNDDFSRDYYNVATQKFIGDINTYMKNGINGYVATPSGQLLKYNYIGDFKSVIGSNFAHDYADPNTPVNSMPNEKPAPRLVTE